MEEPGPPGTDEHVPAEATPPAADVSSSPADASRTHRRVQRFCRLISLSVFVYAALLWPAALAWLIPALSPQVALGSVVGREAMILTALVGIPALALVIWRTRWLCRWACPVGLVLEGCGALRGLRGRPYRYIPPLGRWLALLTLGSAVVGLPMFLWLDPLAILGGAMQGARWPVTLVAAAPAIALAALLAVSLAFPGLWCRKLCPLGGTQEWCGALGRVLQAGPRQTPGRTGWDANRRMLVRSVGFCAAGVLAGDALRALVRRNTKTRLLPPGTVDADELAGRCIRCGNCVRACPAGIIHQDLDPARPHMLLTPVIRFDGRHCLPDCHACTQACPSGAIARLTRAEKNAWPIGLAHIDSPHCYLVTEETECGHCIQVCPREAIVEGFCEDAWRPTIRVAPDKCNGCGACLPICPPKVITLEPVRLV